LHLATSTRSRRIRVSPWRARHITSTALVLLFLTGSLYVISLQLGHFAYWTKPVTAIATSFMPSPISPKLALPIATFRSDLYLPAQYSPLLYRLYALPSRLASENIFLGPRLMALAAFSLCIAMVLS